MTKQLKKDFTALLFLLPFLVLYVVFAISPMIQGIYMSFHKWNLITDLGFVGLDNYKTMIADPDFWDSLWHTTFFVILSTPLMVVLALLLALICNMNTRLKKFFRIAFFLPSVLSVAVISYVSIFVLQPYTGLLNTFLHYIGIKAEPYWLADQNLAWITIVVTTVWWTVGFNMILFLSALQDISDELYEAAALDGATTMQVFWQITLPLLKPISEIIILLQVIASFKVFSQIWLITRGGPGTATRPLIQYIYETGFRKSNLSYASTMSYGLFVILVVLAVIQFKVNNRSKEV